MLRSGYTNPQCGLPGSVSPFETLERLSQMARMIRSVYHAFALVYLFMTACSQPPPGKGEGEIGTSQGGSSGAVQFRVETVASGLEVPWTIAFTPDGRVLFTERPGRVRVIENGSLRPEPLATIEAEALRKSMTAFSAWCPLNRTGIL